MPIFNRKEKLMKKYFALLLLLPTALMVISGAAQAQRKNTTAHDVKPACMCEGKADCGCAAMKSAEMPYKMNKKDKKTEKTYNKKDKMSYDKKVDKWAAERSEEINEQYGKIVKKINHSDLSKQDAAKLQQIATDNKDIAQRHVIEISDRIKDSHPECMAAGDNHKLCKKIDKILVADD